MTLCNMVIDVERKNGVDPADNITYHYLEVSEVSFMMLESVEKEELKMKKENKAKPQPQQQFQQQGHRPHPYNRGQYGNQFRRNQQQLFRGFQQRGNNHQESRSPFQQNQAPQITAPPNRMQLPAPPTRLQLPAPPTRLQLPAPPVLVASQQGRKEIRCFKCESTGHIARNCPKKNDETIRAPPTEARYNNTGGPARGPQRYRHAGQAYAAFGNEGNLEGTFVVQDSCFSLHLINQTMHLKLQLRRTRKF